MQKRVGRPLHGIEKNAHSNLNRLRLKLVNKKTRSMAKQVLRKLQGGLAPVANEGVDIVTCDQAKHWAKVENVFLSNGVRAPGRSHLLMHKYNSLHKQLFMQS